jgi:hypothetical protein
VFCTNASRAVYEGDVSVSSEGKIFKNFYFPHQQGVAVFPHEKTGKTAFSRSEPATPENIET